MFDFKQTIETQPIGDQSLPHFFTTCQDLPSIGKHLSLLRATIRNV